MRTPLRVAVVAAVFIVLNAVTANAQSTPIKPRNALDKGDFRVGFSPITRAKDAKKKMPDELTKAFQEVVDPLNAVIALPHDVYLNMDLCGQANAFYSPSTNEITICYELLLQFENEFKLISKDPKEIDNMVQDTLVQTLFHELGHCLIDVWELPATGREEDAVDQLATVLLLDGSPEGVDSAINAALEFSIASTNDNPNDMTFWDAHSFSKTRFYDMLCLVYGSDPKKNAGLVGPDALPKERAVRCSEEYKRADRAWTKLLTPYLMQ
jgi:hypothetical protein